MTCTQVRERLAAFVALDLDSRDEENLREHLTVCPACRQALGEREPSFHLVWPLAAIVGEEDEAFTGEVLAGLHQRRLQRRLAIRRPGLLAAAAALIALLGGALAVRQGGWWTVSAERSSERAVANSVQTPYPSFVEVQADGVRVYQVAVAGKDAIGVAVVVKPGLEL